MKRLKDPYTPLITVAMMLVSVVAVMFFTVPVEYDPSPSPEELAPVLGDWKPLLTENMWDSGYDGKPFTLKDDLSCIFFTIDKTCQYQYDSRTNTVTITLPENPAAPLKYTLIDYHNIPVLTMNDQYYVKPEHYLAATDYYEFDQDVKPPVIVQCSEAELAPILGEWKDISGSNSHESFQAINLNKDMTCTVLSTGETHPYNYDPSAQILTIYHVAQQSRAAKYHLTQTHGFTMLVSPEAAVVAEGDTDKQYVLDGINTFFTRRQDYVSAHDAYDKESFEGKLRRHQATRETLLEGKIPFAERLPYRNADYLDIYYMSGHLTEYSPGSYNPYLVYLNAYMTTPECASLKITEALRNIRLVSTSINDDWTQEELETHFSVPVYSTCYFDGSPATVDSVLYLEESGTINEENYWDYLLSFDFALSLTPDDERATWGVENLEYQDLFIFFEIYGEEGTFFIQVPEP